MAGSIRGCESALLVPIAGTTGAAVGAFFVFVVGTIVIIFSILNDLVENILQFCLFLEHS